MRFLERLIQRIAKQCAFGAESSCNLPKGRAETEAKVRVDVDAVRQMNRLMAERRKRDKVDELMSQDGFFARDHVRDGYIYYVEDGRLCEIYYEGSCRETHSIGVLPIDLREWIYPKGEKIDMEHQLTILRDLHQWLKNQNIRSNLDLPSGSTVTDQPCVWAHCGKPRIKGSAYCLHHYELNLLRR